MRRIERRAATNLGAAFLVAIAILIGQSAALGKARRDGCRAAQHRPRKTPSFDLLDLDGKPFDLRQVEQGPRARRRVHPLGLPDFQSHAPEVPRTVRQVSTAGRRFLFDLRRSAREARSDSRASSRVRVSVPGAPRSGAHARRANRSRRSRPRPSCSTAIGRSPTAAASTICSRISARSRDTAEQARPARRHRRDLAGRPVAEPVTKAIGCYIRRLEVDNERSWVARPTKAW